MILTVTTVGPNAILDAQRHAKQLREPVEIRKGARTVLFVSEQGDITEAQAPPLRVSLGVRLGEALLDSFGPRRRNAMRVANRILYTNIEEVAA